MAGRTRDPKTASLTPPGPSHSKALEHFVEAAILAPAPTRTTNGRWEAFREGIIGGERATTATILWESNITVQQGDGLRRHVAIAAAVFGLLARHGHLPESPVDRRWLDHVEAVPCWTSSWAPVSEYDADMTGPESDKGEAVDRSKRINSGTVSSTTLIFFLTIRFLQPTTSEPNLPSRQPQRVRAVLPSLFLLQYRIKLHHNHYEASQMSLGLGSMLSAHRRDTLGQG